MEEEVIKSAFELAMERISGMPELTPEEKAAQKEKEYGPMGTALAVKYMNGTLSDTQLPVELNRYNDIQQPIVRRALISSLCSEIRFEKNPGNARRAFNGLAQIAPEKRDLIEECKESYLKIVGEFEAAREKGFREFGGVANERMKALGISGSAVRPNLNENEQWKQELTRIQQSFEPELEQLRNTLMQKLA